MKTSSAGVRVIGFVAVLCLGLAVRGAAAQLVNGSFETQDFTGWTTTDMNTPLQALSVVPLGTLGYFGNATAPTDGGFSAITGFDGDGPGTISVAQDVTISKAAPMVLFDYNAEWDLIDFGGGTIPRTFSVLVEPSGGGSALATYEVLRLKNQTASNGTGEITAAVDLKAFANQAVRLKLAWFVPENFTGPAFCELDNVRLVGKKVAATDALSLQAKLDLLQQAKDTLTLSLVVPVEKGFDPNNKPVTIGVGDLSTDFVLDAQGHATSGNSSLSAKPVPKHGDSEKFTFAAKQADLLAALTASGITNADTPAGGVVVKIPVSVLVDAVTTNRNAFVVWSAKHDQTGTASGKASSELQTAKLTVKLDFATASHDAVALKATAVTLPGFTADSTDVTVDVGSLERVFTLDASGHGVSGSDTIVVKRTAQNPSLVSVVVKVSGDLQGAFVPDGLLNADVPAPGAAITLPVKVTIGGRVTEAVLPTTYIAKAGKSGKDTGTL